jgi:hypothetical protein
MGIDARAQAESLSWHMVARQFERRLFEIVADQDASTDLVQPLQNPF